MKSFSFLFIFSVGALVALIHSDQTGNIQKEGVAGTGPSTAAWRTKKPNLHEGPDHRQHPETMAVVDHSIPYTFKRLFAVYPCCVIAGSS